MTKNRERLRKIDLYEIQWATSPVNLYTQIELVKDADGREVYAAPSME